ncbi:hypothetical protein GCM10009584_27490 [Ornithinimicrobium humiphilum]|uniref:Allene oxide cyclase barrel-like domain-containing protein n=1 Tax=Ornithinimicrobium humiphilum TaxID=125288 RepID=A0A543KP32_9MICO|nr:hypothetical protein [Ornithinimicrobium humiphilum]TQM96832.1 hypothetical protein FB476_1724 [Ornithinimicrobium humiphilum]
MMISIASLALALAASLPTAAAVSTAAPDDTAAQGREVIQFSMVGADAESIQVIGSEGDLVLWEEVLVSVYQRSDEAAGTMLMGSTVYACPEGTEYGDLACEFRSWTNRNGYDMTVTADNALNAVSVSGALDVYDPETFEIIGQEDVELTFTGVGKQSRLIQDNGKGWERSSLATGHIGAAAWVDVPSSIFSVRYHYVL